ncbi:MAG TPA: hypothetical protein VFS00_34455, partial [Polyangiaceae bacterium]|nr:hypothetical protein [Polyangiaceae bacterium]
GAGQGGDAGAGGAGQGGAGAGGDAGTGGAGGNGGNGGGAAGSGGQGCPVAGAAGAGGNGGGGGALPPAPGTVFASGQNNVAQMVSDGTSLFWVVAGTPGACFADGKVLSCPLAGCDTPTVLAANQAKPEHLSLPDENINAVGLADDNVYWTTSLGGEVKKCGKTGCGGAPTVIAQGQKAPAGLATTLSLPKANSAAEPVVMWASFEGNQVMRCSTDPAKCASAGPAVAADGLAGPSYLVSGNSFTYWLENGATEGAGRLTRLTKTGGAVTTLEPGFGRFSRVVLSFAILFAVDRGTAAEQYQNGRLVIVNPTSGAVIDRVEAQPNTFDVLADANYVYWNSNGTLFYCPDAGCLGAAPQVVPDGVGVGSGPLLDRGDSIYFARDGEIRRIAKPAPPSPPTVARRRPLSD